MFVVIVVSILTNIIMKNNQKIRIRVILAHVQQIQSLISTQGKYFHSHHSPDEYINGVTVKSFSAFMYEKI